MGYVTVFSDVEAVLRQGARLGQGRRRRQRLHGQFRPYDKITREEFAALLCNFAKSKG